jgi:hypothetical protein
MQLLSRIWQANEPRVRAMSLSYSTTSAGMLIALVVLGRAFFSRFLSCSLIIEGVLDRRGTPS